MMSLRLPMRAMVALVMLGLLAPHATNGQETIVPGTGYGCDLQCAAPGERSYHLVAKVAKVPIPQSADPSLLPDPLWQGLYGDLPASEAPRDAHLFGRTLVLDEVKGTASLLRYAVVLEDEGDCTLLHEPLCWGRRDTAHLLGRPCCYIERGELHTWLAVVLRSAALFLTCRCV